MIDVSMPLVVLVLAVSAVVCDVASAQATTYCNPVNLDYGYCPVPNQVEQGKHRSTADPAIVVFRGDYYLFSTNQCGLLVERELARLDVCAAEVSQAGAPGAEVGVQGVRRALRAGAVRDG